MRGEVRYGLKEQGRKHTQNCGECEKRPHQGLKKSESRRQRKANAVPNYPKRHGDPRARFGGLRGDPEGAGGVRWIWAHLLDRQVPRKPPVAQVRVTTSTD